MRREVYSKLSSIPSGDAGSRVINGCLVLEGGAFRGLYTQGALDAWMQREINFSCTVGVSAGALAGMSYVSGQIGRSARANLGHRHESDYIGTGALKKSRSLIRLDYLLNDYNTIEPLNAARFLDPSRRFVAESTNCRTGEPAYWEKGSCDIYTAVKSSASMPFVTPMVNVEGVPCLDGGCSCGIPFRWAMEEGYQKIVVIRTRHRDFRKKPKEKATAEAVYRRWPEFARATDRMNLTYNELCQELNALEDAGRIFVLAPTRPIGVSRVEGNMEKLGALYWQGYTDAMNAVEALAHYLGTPV